MTPPKYEWKPYNGRSGGSVLWAGRVRLCHVAWSALNREETKPWRVEVFLPGIKPKEGTDRFATPEEAKARAEQIANTWFEWLGE